MGYAMKEIIITASVLILCILLIRRLFQGKITGRFRYALWLLVALRLMIPVSALIRLPADWPDHLHFMELMSRVEESATEAVERLEEPIQVTVDSKSGIYHLLAEDSAEVPFDEEVGEADGASAYFVIGHLRFSWLDVLGWIWIAGMLLSMVWIMSVNTVFAWRLKKERREIELSEEAVSVLRSKLPPKIADMCKNLRIYTMEGLVSPCLYGMPGREAVYLTPDMAEDMGRLSHVLTHELCHKRHGDSFWGILRSLLIIVYWFHPLVWAAAVLSKRDCELACDETALRLLGEEERISYGQTLLSIITHKGQFADLLCTATTMTGSSKSVKERIRCIAEKPKARRAAMVLAAVLLAAVFVLIFTQIPQIGRTGILALEKDALIITGADMQITLPDSIVGISGRVVEEGSDDIIICQMSSRQEVGRFSRRSFAEVLELVEEDNREIVLLGNYGDNSLMREYLWPGREETTHTYTPAAETEHAYESVEETERIYEPEEETGHTYTPAGQAEDGESGKTSGVLQHEDIYSSGDNDQPAGVPGTDSRTTQIPSPEETDSQTIHLPYEEGQSLDVEDTDDTDDTDDTTYMLDDTIDYLPNEQIVTVDYPAGEASGMAHKGCYVYIKGDYTKLDDQYREEMEFINRELEALSNDVIVLSLNREIRETLFDAMTENRTLYVGDNVKVSALINAMPVPSTLHYSGEIALQTAEDPYSLQFTYEMTTDSIPQEDIEMMYFNALMLFYAIDNVEAVTIQVRHPAGSGSDYSLHFYRRKDMEETFPELSQVNFDDGQIFREQLAGLHDRAVTYLNQEFNKN